MSFRPELILSVGKARCICREPQARHGARLPFDFLLHSLAEEYGARAICVILSGTGADGSLGLKAIRGKRRARDRAGPRRGRLRRHAAQRDHDGRGGPCAARGAIPAALHGISAAHGRLRHVRRMARQRGDAKPDGLPRSSICCARKRRHDFTLYKPGTLQRRIEAAHGDGRDRNRRHGSLSRHSARRRQANSTCWPRTC